MDNRRRAWTAPDISRTARCLSDQPPIGDIQRACPHPANVPVTHPAFWSCCCEDAPLHFIQVRWWFFWFQRWPVAQRAVGIVWHAGRLSGTLAAQETADSKGFPCRKDSRGCRGMPWAPTELKWHGIPRFFDESRAILIIKLCRACPGLAKTLNGTGEITIAHTGAGTESQGPWNSGALTQTIKGASICHDLSQGGACVSGRMPYDHECWMSYDAGPRNILLKAGTAHG